MTNAAQATDNFTSLIGDLYSRWTLDCLVEIGYAVSMDFISRPQIYQADDIPEEIVTLRVSYGTDPKFPNTQERQSLMLPVFGRSDGLKPDASKASSQFQVARKKLIDACIAFSERAVDTGLPMLEERVRSALVPFRAYFEGLKGRSVSLGGRQILAVSDTVYNILRSSGISKVFGFTAPDPAWPLISSDPNGAKVVEAAGAALLMPPDQKMMPMTPPDYKMSYTKFILLQRVGQEGGTALSVVLTADVSDETALADLISHVYTWGTSLRDFQQAS